MGNYYFTSVEDKKNETKVEYTFGYIKDKKGNLRINLHHSSIPHLSLKIINQLKYFKISTIKWIFVSKKLLYDLIQMSFC